MLKDDKTYPWICIKKERFPDFRHAKNHQRRIRVLWPLYQYENRPHLLDLIKGLYPLRTCNYDLSAEKIEAKNIKSA